MELNVSELEQRLSNLQWQVERLWQMAEGNGQPLEQRLAAMADQYAEYLKRWAATAERQAQAVSQLESYVSEWKEATARQQDMFQRLRELEATIQREWDTLKKIHEQPVRELREQAAGLTEVCIATASVAQQELDRHEARLTTFQNDIDRRLSEFGRDLQSAITEIRTRTGHAAGRFDPTAAPWSLDDVMRLHGQLRDSSSLRPGGNIGRLSDQSVDLDRPALPPAIAARVEDLRRTRSESSQIVDSSAQVSHLPAGSTQQTAWKWRAAVVGIGLAIVIAGAFGWQLWNQVQVAAARVQNAELSQKVVEDATRQAAAAREEAAREISGAREMANRAERISNVLAAPDLVRINLFGGSAAPGASAQALWSRTRGIVFSGSRIPPPPANGTHQLWLLTRMEPVRATRFVPEPDGTVTLVEEAPNVPRPVVGMMVTAGAGDNASGEPILTSVPPLSVQ